MTGLFFDAALLPQGWAHDVRIAVDAGRIISVGSGGAAEPGDEHHRIGLSGMCNLHSHAFQRGMAGLAEIRERRRTVSGPGATSCIVSSDA